MISSDLPFHGKLFSLSLDRTESEAAHDVLLKQDHDGEHGHQRHDADDTHFAPTYALCRDQLRNHDWKSLDAIAAEHEREQEFVPGEDEAKNARRHDAVSQEWKHHTHEDLKTRPPLQRRGLFEFYRKVAAEAAQNPHVER